MIESLSQPFTFLNTSFWAFMLVGLAATEKQVRMRNAYLFLASLFFYWKTSGALWPSSSFLPSQIGGLWRWILGGGSEKVACSEFDHQPQRFAVFQVRVLHCGRPAAAARSALIQPHAALGSGRMRIWERRSAWIKSSCRWGFRSTFQTMSYAIDVYRKSNQWPFWILGFRELFPAAGGRALGSAKSFIPQLHQPYRLSRVEFGTGLFWILNGLIKKIWLAITSPSTWWTACLPTRGATVDLKTSSACMRTVSRYADFNGYTDMANAGRSTKPKRR